MLVSFVCLMLIAISCNSRSDPSRTTTRTIAGPRAAPSKYPTVNDNTAPNEPKPDLPPEAGIHDLTLIRGVGKLGAVDLSNRIPLMVQILTTSLSMHEDAKDGVRKFPFYEYLNALPETQRASALQIAMKLENSPSWTHIKRDDKDGRKRLESAIKEVSLPDPEALVIGMVAFAKSKEAHKSRFDLDARSTIFVFNRFYFDVSPETALGEHELFGGWVGVPYTEKTVNMLWPWEKKGDELVLTGSFEGYVGEEYDPFAEFNYFYKHFKVRGKRGEK